MKAHNMKDDTRIALLEQSNEFIREALNRLEKKIDNMDSMFNGRFDKMDKIVSGRFDRIENRLWSNFIWMIGGFVGVLALVAHTQHWII